MSQIIHYDFTNRKNLALNFKPKKTDQALIELVGLTDAPSYIVHYDEKTGEVNISSALTDRLSFERKKEIAKAVSAAIQAI